MAAVMVAVPANRQHRRCITFKDHPAGFDHIHSAAEGPSQACRDRSQGPSRAAGRKPHSHHTVMNLEFAETLIGACAGCFIDLTDKQLKAGTGSEQLTYYVQESAPMQRRATFRRAKTMGAEPLSEVAVAVVAPGGGTGMNSSVYSALARKEGFTVDILGQSRAAYDRYPAAWANDGCPPPNLETFALDLAAQGRIQQADCLVVGSRGGQVVLPTLWNALGSAVPPAVVMNGGCAMWLPTPVRWPSSAVTFVLLGGADYFRGQMDMKEYLADAQSRVPDANETTAILLVHEMVHMPQSELLMPILQHMIRAVTSWKATEEIPLDEFRIILNNLSRGGWSGKLTHKTGKGDAWETQAF